MSRSRSPIVGMAGGLAAAAVALGIAQLLAVAIGPSADARTAAGSAVIDLTPGPVKEWAITTFGTSDKLFLTVMVLVVIAVISAIAALWETRRRPVASAVIVVGGLAGCAAVLTRPGASLVDTIPCLIGAVCGVIVLRFAVIGPPASSTEPVPQRSNRRQFFGLAGLIGLGILATAGGNLLLRKVASVAADRDAFDVPAPASPSPPVPLAVQPSAVALPRFLTPNEKFYRIDTALNVPQLSRTDWRLTVHGMTDREITYRWRDLTSFEVIERVITLTCVSNPIGGELISTARWSGYRVRDLLAAAGVQPGADMVLSTSVDGFTAGTPLEVLTDGRDAMLAVTMNGAPLPVEHGYPARLVVPGLYGYVSATKWLVDLEVTRFDRAQAYWTQRGWAPRAPIKTQSRIDVPRSFQTFAPGPVVFGGVAWAQHRGVQKVEVRIDNGDWKLAELATAYSNDTWRLWSYRWNAVSGTRTITVRATDGTGTLQTQQRADPIPDGAAGWNSVVFTVT